MSDLISRQAVIDAVKSRKTAEQSSAGIMRNAVVDFCVDIIKKLPSAQPQPVVRCKDCKHWKDSDGVYRRGVGAESKCPLNIQEVYAGTFYCGYAERRTDSNGRD